MTTCSWLIILGLSVVLATAEEEYSVFITADPSTTPYRGESVQLICEAQCTIDGTAMTIDRCSIAWSYERLDDGRQAEATSVAMSAAASGGTSVVVVQSEKKAQGKWMRSVLKVRAEEAMYVCRLLCAGHEPVSASIRIDVRNEQEPGGRWAKSNLSITMISLVLVVFVVCMLLTGLLLHVRQCWRRRKFLHHQQNFCDGPSSSSSSQQSLSSSHESLYQSPPSYLEAVRVDQQFKEINSVDGKLQQTVDMSGRNGRTHKHTGSDCDTLLKDLCEQAAECTLEEPLYTTPESNDCFSSAQLSLSLNEHDTSSGKY